MMAETNWLQLAKDAHQSSTSYVDANYRKKWEDGLRMFQSRHPQDSKYLSDAYKHRSKIFRPKSRSLVRKHEAAAAVAASRVDPAAWRAFAERHLGSPQQITDAPRRLVEILLPDLSA